MRTGSPRDPTPARNVESDIEDEILANLLEAITEEMGWIVLRSAHSTYVKETRDFATALVSRGGEVFAFPAQVATLTNSNVPMSGFIEALQDPRPGDVFISNDPYSTKGTITHLPDLHLLRPVFIGSKLLCYAWAFMHASDVGGASPGSVLLTNSDVYQEGLRIRPTKLYREGRLNEDVWHLMLDNCRIPEQNEGDLGALVAAVALGDLRVQRLVTKYGLARAERAISAVLDQTEERTRAVLRRIPAGKYEFVDYLEDDFVSHRPVRIQLTLGSDGDGRLQLDFRGTDPQVRSAINIVTGDQRHHAVLANTLMRFIMTQAEAFHLNAGLIRCIEMIAPAGSLLNARFPAATGMRATTAIRVRDIAMGALNRAVPGIVPAGGGSQAVIVSIATSDVGGRSRVVVANPLMGGSGGGPDKDGMSGCDYSTSQLRNVPVEVLETESPALVHRLALEPDSEGAGKYRGGFGLRYEFEVRKAGATVVMRGKERQRFEPWGFGGGSAAGVGSNYVLTDGEPPRDLKKETLYKPRPGDVIGITSPGGGGFGDPLAREPASVLDDWMDDLVSAQRADSVYGVVIRDGRIDVDATERRRSDLRAARGPLVAGASFDRGRTRSEWESRLGYASERLAHWLESLPVGVRQEKRERALRMIEDMDPAPIDKGRLDRLIRDLGDDVSPRPDLPKEM